MQVVGVDGCPGGWVAVSYDPRASSLSARVHRSFREMLLAYPAAAAIGIDVPIGLAEGEPRACDLAARRVLGPRRSSVFAAPDPRLLDAPSYSAALDRARALTGGGISRQAFAIFPRVAEVNEAMTPTLQERVIEVHPEVAFWALTGKRPLAFPKRRPEGYEERHALLTATLGLPVWSRVDARGVARPAAPDDLLDALVVAWVARRSTEGRAERFLLDPPRDRRGLRMEIVY